MALVSKKEACIEEKSKKEVTWYRVYPDIYQQIDYNKKEVNIEINLPGVKKEEIIIKTLPTWFHIEAKRNPDNILYSADTNFTVEIIPERTKAKYHNGLLKITAFIRDPLADVKEVELK